MMDNLRDPNGQEEREPLQPGEDSQPMEETLAREEGFAQPAGPETPEELEPLPPEDRYSSAAKYPQGGLCPF